ncbi:hypothetical protein JCM4914_50170 [Streptomyces platensis subsp. malvinus]
MTALVAGFGGEGNQGLCGGVQAHRQQDQSGLDAGRDFHHIVCVGSLRAHGDSTRMRPAASVRLGVAVPDGQSWP